jgi:DNA polymerase-3 subunit epsilon
LQIELVFPPSPPAAVDDGIVVFDVETTGTDRRNDQVIELCVQFGLDSFVPRARTWRFKPTVPISPGAQAVHGISMEDLEDCPPFAACADEIAEVFAAARVVVGYNLAFDIDMILAEYERLSRPGPDFGGDGRLIVDAFRLWQQYEPRSLQHAHKKFVGDAFAAAHSASADVAATGRVLRGMLDKFGLSKSEWAEVAKACDPDGRLSQNRAMWVGPSKHLQWNEQGQIVMTFGKHTGLSLVQVAQKDAGYLRWVIDKDFPSHVGEICRRAIELVKSRDGEADLAAWARQRYGQAAPTEAPPFAANG